MKHIAERFRGYREAMATFNPESDVLEGKVRYQHVEDDTQVTLQSFWDTDPGIDSIVFATNTLTVAGLYFFQNKGIKIPEDIAVIGFDGNVAFDFFYSPLTYIKQPVKEMGKKAVQILINKINGVEEYEQVRFQHELIIRESSK